MSSIRLHLLPFSLLSVLQVAAFPSAGIFLNSTSSTTSRSSSSFSHTHSGCDHCTVTALEAFLTYPHSVEVEEVTSTNVVVPMVTVHPDGRLETNYITETQKADPTAPTNTGPPQPTDPYATLTWEPYPNVTLTYPTTYVEFFDLSGGTFYPISPVVEPTATCTYDDQALLLPENSETGLVVPLPTGVTYDPREPAAISAPAAIHSYLNGIPAVASQFGGTDVASCAWTKIVVGRTSTAAQPGVSATQVPVAKVSVSVLTEVTARQVVITATGNNRATTTQAIAHVENPDTALVQPPGNTPQPNNPPANNNPPAQGQQQAGGSQTTGGGLAGVIGAVFNPAPTSGGNGGSAQGGSGGTQGGNNGGSGGVNAQAVPSGGGATGGSNGQTGGATGGSTGGNAQTGGGASGNAQSGSSSGGVVQPGGQGGQANGALPAPLVMELGGTLTTIAPTVIPAPGSTGSMTAFILGPGSTLMLGGSPITVSGTAVSAPGAATTGGVGGAIASGLGYTGPLASDNAASSIHGPNLPIWMLATVAGVVGVLAVSL